MNVKVTPLKRIPTEGGEVLHMLKQTDEAFTSFGEIYFSIIQPDVIKGWHRRIKATRQYAVVEGTITLVLYDGNEFQELTVGEENYCLVTIPPGVWSSFKAKEKKAIVADLTNIPYSEEDAEKQPIDFVEYW